MLKHTTIKRSLATGLAIGAAGFPAAAQARVFQVEPSGPVASQPAQVVSVPAVQQPGPTAQSGFDWGDAGIGAIGALALIGVGGGAAGAMRRRSAHRAMAG